MTLAGLIEEKVEAPKGVTITVDASKVTVKGPKGQVTRELRNPKTKIVKAEGGVVVRCEMPRVKDKALVGTYAAHVRNMIEGVTDGFTYDMKIVYSHFPMKTSVKGDRFIIENFLGERSPRVAKILGDTKIVVKGADVTVTGTDIEKVSQTAANIERATHIWGYDPRVFQDGIYITAKARRPEQ